MTIQSFNNAHNSIEVLLHLTQDHRKGFCQLLTLTSKFNLLTHSHPLLPDSLSFLIWFGCCGKGSWNSEGTESYGHILDSFASSTPVLVLVLVFVFWEFWDYVWWCISFIPNLLYLWETRDGNQLVFHHIFNALHMWNEQFPFGSFLSVHSWAKASTEPPFFLWIPIRQTQLICMSKV